MIIHCPYCKKEITDKNQNLGNPDRYMACCYHDDVKITLIYHLGMCKDVMFIWLETPKHLLVLSKMDNYCWLYVGPDPVTGTFEHMMHLDHLPDITPENAKQWIDRLLNIKAFS